MRGESRHNLHPDKNSAAKLVEAVKALFLDAGSTPAASTSFVLLSPSIKSMAPKFLRIAILKSLSWLVP